VEEEKKTEKKKVKHIIIQVVEQRGQSALVEWPQEGDLRRAYVPVDAISNAKCDEDVLNAGLPYGVPWEDLIDASGLMPEAIGKELRRLGFWTAVDIEKSIQGTQRAINKATGLTPASLHTLAKQYETEED
jgi:hypothetical protein